MMGRGLEAWLVLKKGNAGLSHLYPSVFIDGCPKVGLLIAQDLYMFSRLGLRSSFLVW